MTKEFFNKYPFISFAGGVVTLLAFQSLLVGYDSVITQAMIQAGWCGADDYICLLRYYISFSSLIILLGISLDFIINFSRKRLSQKHEIQIGPTLRENVKVPPAIFDRFSFHLDEITKGKDIRGVGLGFLSDIKSTPPFLGVRHDKPIISKHDEQILTEFFLAQIYMENNRDAIRGGTYQMRHGDGRKLIAKKVYGDEKYARWVDDRLTYPNGSWLELPYLNLNSPDDSEFIKRKISMSRNTKQIISLLLSYNLVEDEAIPLLRIIYDAAQKTLDERKKI